jgi:hypoxanthine phosphoribosyltransferase
MNIPEHYRLFLTRERIENRMGELAADLSKIYNPTDTIFVGILGGALFFMADLVRRLEPTYQLDYMSISSYFGTEAPTGKMVINKDVNSDCRGARVLILDDILDSGHTLAFAKKHILEMGAASVDGVVLMAKERHRADCMVSHVGFFVPETFYIGYGLDLGGRYRSLRDIYMKEVSNA